MGPALAVATLDGWTCEGTAVFTAEVWTAPAASRATVVPCGAGIDAHVTPVAGCAEGRVVATLRERTTGRMAHRLAFGEGATTDEAVARAVAAFRAALANTNTATQETV